MEEALTLQQRIKRSRIMKVKSKMIARKRKIAMRKRAGVDKIKKRANKAARKIIQDKILKDRDNILLNRYSDGFLGFTVD